jgi:hypothetical protein
MARCGRDSGPDAECSTEFVRLERVSDYGECRPEHCSGADSLNYPAEYQD